MNNSTKSIANSIANITTINNQTAIIAATTFSSAENTFTSLGGAIGNVSNSEDLNHLLNEAVNHSYQNLQNQAPNLPGITSVKNPEITASSSIHQSAPMSRLSLYQSQRRPNNHIQNHTAPL